MAKQDSNWQAVAQFVSDLRNASRLATYVDTVVGIFQTGAWRSYTDPTGRSDTWREAEFDYFLIASGAQYSEIQRLLTWDKAKAVDLAGAMESDDARARRPIEEASSAWQSPTGVTLSELAARHGWTRPSGELRVPPVPQRARARARHGLTKDEHARQARASKLSEERRQQLDAVAAALVEQAADEVELRFLIDALRDRLRAKP